MALPAVRSFRKEFNGSELTLVVEGVSPPFMEREADCLISVASSEPWKESSGGAGTRFRCVLCEFASESLTFGQNSLHFFLAAPILRGPRPCELTELETVYTRSYIFGGALRDEGEPPRELAEPVRMIRFLIKSKQVAWVKLTSMPDFVVIHPGSSPLGFLNRWEFGRTLPATLARMFHGG